MGPPNSHGIRWEKVIPPAPNENPADMMKMYILINRKKLSLVQCGVQAAHAAAEYVHYNKDVPSTKEWAENHRTMIFLEADEKDIEDMAQFFENNGKKAYRFLEPDLNDLLTACAFEPCKSSDGKIYFSRFPLLK